MNYPINSLVILTEDWDPRKLERKNGPVKGDLCKIIQTEYDYNKCLVKVISNKNISPLFSMSKNEGYRISVKNCIMAHKLGRKLYVKN